MLRRAYDHHRDLRTRLPAPAVADPIDRARQFMTITPPLAIPHHRSHPASLSHRQRPRFAHSDPRRHLRPTNLQHQTPDHRTNPIQSAQTQRPPGRSTVVLSGTHKSDQAAATNSHRPTPASVRTPPAVSSLEGYRTPASVHPHASVSGRHPITLNDSGRQGNPE